MCFPEGTYFFGPGVKGAIGVTFTPTTIIAAWFDPSETLQHLQVPASPAYQTFYATTLEKYNEGRDEKVHKDTSISVGDSGDLEAMFTQAMTPLTTVLTERLGRQPTYLCVSLPSAFGKSIISLAARTLATLNDPSRPLRSGSNSKAMGLPCNLFDKKTLVQRV